MVEVGHAEYVSGGHSDGAGDSGQAEIKTSLGEFFQLNRLSAEANAVAVWNARVVR